MMWFDISKLLIITQAQFNDLITLLDCNLSINDSCYMITYLFTNLFAWLLIVIVVKVVMMLFFELFSRKKILKWLD